MNKKIKKYLISILAALMTFSMATFVGCGESTGSKSQMTASEISQYLNFSRIVLPMIAEPVSLKIQTDKDGAESETLVKLSVENVTYNEKTSLSAQLEASFNGKTVLKLRLLADGLYLESQITDLYVPFDFAGLMEGLGIGGESGPTGDADSELVLDDLFFGDYGGETDSESGENVIESLFKTLASISSGSADSNGYTIIVPFGTAIQGIYAKLLKSENQTLKSIAPLILDVFGVKNALGIPKMDGAFRFDKEGSFKFFTLSTIVKGIKIGIDLKFIKDYHVDVEVNKNDYLNALEIFDGDGLSDLGNFALGNLISWLQNGNFSFNFTTNTKLVTYDAPNGKEYVVKGKAAVEFQPLPLDKIIDGISAYFAEKESGNDGEKGTAENTAETTDGEGSASKGAGISISIEDITALLGIIKDAFKGYVLNINANLEMALYEKDDVTFANPVSELHDFSISITKSGFKKNDGAYITQNGGIIDGQSSLAELFYDFFLQNEVGDITAKKLTALKIAFIKTDSVITGITVTVNNETIFTVTEMTSQAIETE